jgi:hypothetical protein
LTSQHFQTDAALGVVSRMWWKFSGGDLRVV